MGTGIHHPDAGRRADYAPVGAGTGSSIFSTLKRTFTEFSEDNMTDWAAALTYYGLLSLFPALIALVSIVGLVGDPASTTKTLTDIVRKIGPASAAKTFSGPIQSVTSHKSASGIMLFVGIGAALWSASSYVGAFMRAANVAFETPEGRPIWKLRPLQILVTLAMILIVVAITIGLVLTGPIVDAVAKPLGVGSTATTIWSIAKWPVMLLLLVVLLSVLFHAAPNARQKFSFITPGAVFALVVWIVASAAFAFYVANFGSYDKTYGALGGVVVALVWFWLTNVALLLGLELNAERERSRELAEGVPGADKEIQLDARDEPKRKKTT